MKPPGVRGRRLRQSAPLDLSACSRHQPPDQSYCHRLQHDMYFLTSNSRLNEQVVDKIILQLNRVYPQILTNAEAEKFRNPKASLHTRLSDLIKHLQKKGERHCQEFYRALQINAEQLYNDLPSRKILSPVFFLACFSIAAGFALVWYCCNSDSEFLQNTSMKTWFIDGP
ncbi:caspase recruitment domain-containing protein 19 isoform X5 [Egretta garzetta]|uniref:caspase recruitment domain-containing protein 19 isoform X5 n=1 Tax=Egretta garzetta TaxID=188379 RepID=UPI00163C1D18|nr:caspase recruitment domain-containing protein 19 isoform X5 [Egretta garzetta]